MRNSFQFLTRVGVGSFLSKFLASSNSLEKAFEKPYNKHLIYYVTNSSKYFLWTEQIVQIIESVKSDQKNVTAGDSILQLLRSAIAEDESDNQSSTQTSSDAHVAPRISVISSPQKTSVSTPNKKWSVQKTWFIFHFYFTFRLYAFIFSFFLKFNLK